jgi:hypothetical protein
MIRWFLSFPRRLGWFFVSLLVSISFDFSVISYLFSLRLFCLVTNPIRRRTRAHRRRRFTLFNTIPKLFSILFLPDCSVSFLRFGDLFNFFNILVLLFSSEDIHSFSRVDLLGPLPSFSFSQSRDETSRRRSSTNSISPAITRYKKKITENTYQF